MFEFCNEIGGKMCSYKISVVSGYVLILYAFLEFAVPV